MTLTDYRNAKVEGDIKVVRLPNEHRAVRFTVPVTLADGTHEIFDTVLSLDTSLPRWKELVASHVTKSLLDAAKRWKALTHTPCEFVNDDLRDLIIAEFLV